MDNYTQQLAEIKAIVQECSSDSNEYCEHCERLNFLLKRVRELEEQVRKAGCPRCATWVEPSIEEAP